MNRSSPGMPERLRDAGATNLERRLLEAGAHELPSRELSQRMARAIGVTAGLATTTAAKEAAAAARVATTQAGVSGSSTLVPWITSGVVVAAGIVAAVVNLHPDTHDGARSAPTSNTAVSTHIEPAAPIPCAVVPELPVAASSNVVAPSSPTKARANTSSVDLGDQIALLDAARDALSSGSGDRALNLVNQYQSKYPSGSFRPEAAALKIEALVKLGRRTEARAHAERFVAAHRGSPLADRVARIAGVERP